MAANENTGNSVLGFTYVFTAIACSSLSAFSTFTGFRIMPPVVAALLSAVIFVLLMACDFSILSARRNGGGLLRVPRTLLGPTAMLLLVTVVSTSSSFTFFYSIAMRDRLAAARAVAAGEAFERNYASALKELQSLGSATSKQHNIELALTNLDTQVLHSGRPGFGTEAQIIIRQIYKMMEEAGAPMTPMAFPKPPGTSIDNEIALNRLRTAVNQNLEAAKAGDGVSPSIARITHIHDSLEPTVQEARDDSNSLNFDARVRAIVAIKRATSDIELETNDVLAKFGGKNYSTLKLTAEDIVGIRLYNAPEVYSVAFSNKEGLPYAIGSFVVAVTLDLFPLLLALLLIHPTSNAPTFRARVRAEGAPDLNITGSSRW